MTRHMEPDALHALARPAPRRDPWPAEAERILRYGVAAGLLDDAIARLVTERTGRYVSKDSTLQKRLALGLYREHGPRIAPMPISTSTAPLGVAWKTCQWIEGDPRAKSPKCGAAVEPGRPYCRCHADRAYLRVAA